LSTLANVTTVGFVGGNISYVNDGGTGGKGGLGGFGGKGGAGGKAGTKTSECSAATNGGKGADAPPPPGLGGGSSSNQGATGGHGTGAASFFKQLAPGSCLDQIPLPMTVTSVVPQALCRGNGAGANVDLTVNGTNLDSVTTVTTTLAGVTFAKKPSSTDTHLDLTATLTSSAASGVAPITLNRSFGSSLTQPNAIDVRQFQVTSVTPNTGARGTSVAVTIAGQCFDTTAVLNQVTVSGAGVNTLNVVVVNATTVTCTFDIAAAAPVGARHVTVQTGSMNHTLLNAFTLT
jgi:hypothetical protein